MEQLVQGGKGDGADGADVGDRGREDGDDEGSEVDMDQGAGIVEGRDGPYLVPHGKGSDKGVRGLAVRARTVRAGHVDGNHVAGLGSRRGVCCLGRGQLVRRAGGGEGGPARLDAAENFLREAVVLADRPERPVQGRPLVRPHKEGADRRHGLLGRLRQRRKA